MEERLLGSILSIISVPVAASYDGGSHSFPHEKDFWLWPIPFTSIHSELEFEFHSEF